MAGAGSDGKPLTRRQLRLAAAQEQAVDDAATRPAWSSATPSWAPAPGPIGEDGQSAKASGEQTVWERRRVSPAAQPDQAARRVTGDPMPPAASPLTAHRRPPVPSRWAAQAAKAQEPPAPAPAPVPERSLGQPLMLSQLHPGVVTDQGSIPADPTRPRRSPRSTTRQGRMESDAWDSAIRSGLPAPASPVPPAEPPASPGPKPPTRRSIARSRQVNEAARLPAEPTLNRSGELPLRLDRPFQGGLPPTGPSHAPPANLQEPAAPAAVAEPPAEPIASRRTSIYDRLPKPEPRPAAGEPAEDPAGDLPFGFAWQPEAEPAASGPSQVQFADLISVNDPATDRAAGHLPVGFEWQPRPGPGQAPPAALDSAAHPAGDFAVSGQPPGFDWQPQPEPTLPGPKAEQLDEIMSAEDLASDFTAGDLPAGFDWQPLGNPASSGHDSAQPAGLEGQLDRPSAWSEPLDRALPEEVPDQLRQPLAAPLADWLAQLEEATEGPASSKPPEVAVPAGLATDPAEVDPADTSSSLKAVRLPKPRPTEPNGLPQWQRPPVAPAPRPRQTWRRRLFAHLGFRREGASPVLTVLVMVGLVALLAGVALLVVNLTGGSGGAAPNPPEPTPSPGAPGATEWSKGHFFDQPGSFGFELMSIENGITSLTNDETNLSERGQFFAVQIKVTWQGEGQGTFFADQQQLGTSAGLLYPNEPASANLLKGTSLGFKPFAPGQSIEGYLVFDIPRDGYADRLVLTGELGHEPVIVPLG